jgi:hypothetical protein
VEGHGFRMRRRTRLLLAIYQRRKVSQSQRPAAGTKPLLSRPGPQVPKRPCSDASDARRVNSRSFRVDKSENPGMDASVIQKT